MKTQLTLEKCLKTPLTLSKCSPASRRYRAELLYTGPPDDATHSERFRDNLFAFLDGPCMFKVNIANIIIIIVDGGVEIEHASHRSQFLHRSTARSSFVY